MRLLAKNRGLFLSWCGLFLLCGLSPVLGCKGEKVYPLIIELKYERLTPLHDPNIDMVVMAEDRSARVWVTTAGRERRELNGSDDGLFHTSFSVDKDAEVMEFEVSVEGTYEGDHLQSTHTASIEIPPRLDIVPGGLTCSHGHECSITLGDDGTVTVAAEPGAEVKFGSTEVTLQNATEEISIEALFSDVPLDELLRSGNINFRQDFEASITFPSGDEAIGGFDLTQTRLKEFIAAVFSRVTAGPVSLTDEGDGNAILIWQLDRPSVMTHLDDLEKLGDVRYVAMVEQVNVGERGCGGYRNSAGELGSAIVQVYDHNLSLYDRRSGELLGQNTFHAPSSGGCPTSFNSGIGQGGGAVKPPSSEEYAWIRERIADR